MVVLEISATVALIGCVIAISGAVLDQTPASGCDEEFIRLANEEKKAGKATTTAAPQESKRKIRMRNDERYAPKRPGTDTSHEAPGRILLPSH
mmetsp:Transcript_15694/g.27775  ORF Transcript_15694/g.27775 Transcript_15694/m.27775 type:complete len:93 (+) Transcript_15694:169-447(+)|eukprot:CAMPEP_0194577576 /NCGR_PEP_ID=MMETSP0292-20121207/12308_1 /TAXON_ID=39354 /ORGANISM="Heterosigma akashiwo, Strain CCMP2393" /LENGTH=92 /DNA_ID=CAMNT_0039429997 /DNA_START=203 /DNA_END=481 /DNA_ORIENTATION=+